MTAVDTKVIYIVMGRSGDYSDYNTWPEHAFTAEEDAQAHETKLMVSRTEKNYCGDYYESYYVLTVPLDSEEEEVN